MTTRPLNLSDDFAPVSYEQWFEVVQKALDGASFEKKLQTRTYEGITIAPLYTQKDWDAQGNPSGFPGMAPFTRGSNPLGAAQGGWDICQEHAHPCPEQTNKEILTELERGVSSILLRLDRAGRAGLDADASGAADLAGVDGVMISSVDDLAQVLKGVFFDCAGVVMDAGGQFVASAALLAQVWQRSGVAADKVRGSFGADPLGTLAREGALPVSLPAALTQMAGLAQWTSKNFPNVTAVSVDTAAYHDAGAPAAHDLAYSLATGLAYLKAMTEAGMDVDTACSQMRFSFSLGATFFLAIAKLRAARRLWARVAEACGASPAAQAMKLHARTARRILTVRDPWVNMLRTTVTSFAAAVGGADSITSAPFDAAIGLSDEFSQRIARNTQVILQEESNLGRVIDPAGGCWFIEKLTDELCEKAWALFQEIEKQGGMAVALTGGFVAQQINDSFAPRRSNLAKRKDALTGVSEFPNMEEKPVVTVQPDLADLQKAAAAKLATARKSAQVDLAGAPCLIQAAVDAAGQGATLGVIAAALPGRDAAAKAVALSPRPYAEEFEALRGASDQYLAEKGVRPQIFQANMGPVAHHTARATWSKNFFEAGGFQVIGNKGFKTAEEAVEAFKQSGAPMAVICSSDKLYPDVVPAVTAALKQAGATCVILAGHPGENREAWTAAGVDTYIHIGCDVLSTLQSLLQAQGVIQ